MGARPGRINSETGIKQVHNVKLRVYGGIQDSRATLSRGLDGWPVAQNMAKTL